MATLVSKGKCLNELVMKETLTCTFFTLQHYDHLLSFKSVISLCILNFCVAHPTLKHAWPYQPHS